MNFPKRFEIENLNPLELKCKVVMVVEGRMLGQVFENLEVAQAVVNINDFMGPFADKIDGQWCVRFESREANRQLSI